MCIYTYVHVYMYIYISIDRYWDQGAVSIPSCRDWMTHTLPTGRLYAFRGCQRKAGKFSLPSMSQVLDTSSSSLSMVFSIFVVLDHVPINL